MKLLFVSEGGSHLGCLEMEGDSVVIKKYKPEFQPKVVDAPEEDDNDEGIEPEGMEESGDKEGKMSDVFAMKKKPMEKHEEEETPEYEDEEEQNVKKGKPMKQKRPGLF